MTAQHTAVTTPIGDLTVVSTGHGISGLYFPGHWHLPDTADFGTKVGVHENRVLAQAAKELSEYFAGDRRSFDVPVSASGDAFSEDVWAILREIAYGDTTTYGEIAARLGDRRLAQRVGQAVGHNPVSIIVPCHRVIGADGSLTGFAGGLERKRLLLELEEPAETTASRLF